MMTQPTDASFACHLMLLRLAGRVPDEMLTRCRYDLAAGRLAGCLAILDMAHWQMPDTRVRRDCAL